MSTKRNAPATITAPVHRRSAMPRMKQAIDESNTTVSATEGLRLIAEPTATKAITIVISSDSESEYDESGLDEEEEEDAANKPEDALESPAGSPLAPFASLADGAGHQGKSGVPQLPSPEDTVPQADIEMGDASDAEATSPTFGELIRGQGVIDLTAAPTNSKSALVQHPATAIRAPSLSSLGTVLTQALRTDDSDLLESCLAVVDVATVRNTIERLDSSLAGILLTNLASRLHRRPGRAGSLIQWMQWTLVAHGGALASQPEVLDRLSALQKVLAQRARGLHSLLALKGKLDLLEQQVFLRRRMQARQGGYADEEEDENVIYVEGEEEGGDDVDVANGIGARRKRAIDDGEADELPIVNGIVGDDEDSDSDSSNAEEGVSEAEDDSVDEEEVDHYDLDESAGEDEESDIDAAPPTKMQKLSSSFSKARR